MANPAGDTIEQTRSTTQEPTARAAVKAVEAGHAQDVDIAAQILAEYGADQDQSWTEEEEKRLVRKIDWLIVPIVRRLIHRLWLTTVIDWCWF